MCLGGPRVCGRFGGATTAVSGQQRRSGAQTGGREQPIDCNMELEAVLKERGGASAGDPARVLEAWVKRGWPAAGGPGADTELNATESTNMSRARELSAKGSNDLEYEALPEGSTVTTHMLAGAVAGIMEHCLMYPVDCVKVRAACRGLRGRGHTCPEGGGHHCLPLTPGP